MYRLIFGPKCMKRFWNKVRKTNNCWWWTGSKDAKGYGTFRYKEKTWRAHRVAWDMQNGPIPNGLCVLHKCDNPSCVKLDHLFLGTYRDNALDRESKNRGNHPVKEKSGKSYLTQLQVSEIRKFRKSGMTIRDIAAKIGTSKSNVHKIVLRQTWT